MDAAIGAARSGIRAGITRLDVAAHDLANVSTTDDDGTPIEGRRVTTRDTGTGVATAVEGTGAAVEVAGPLVDAMVARHEVAANASVIRAAHDLYREMTELGR